MLVQKLRDWVYSRKAESLLGKFKFTESLACIKKISSEEKQANLIVLYLLGYAISKFDPDQVHMYKDKAEFERDKALIGCISSDKVLLYINPETDLVEGGVEEVINAIVEEDNPVLQYYRMLKESINAQTAKVV